MSSKASALSRAGLTGFSLFSRRRIGRNLFSPSIQLDCRPEHENGSDFKRHNQNQLQVPVLIVGAGPVGITLSILLSKYGIRSMLVERKSALSQHPQAHFLNNRTMEIFRKLDGLESEIQGLQPPIDQWRKFIYCCSLTGPILGVADHFQAKDAPERQSPTSVAHFSQHRLLQLLYERAQKLSAAHGNDAKPSSVLLRHRLLSLRTNLNGAVATICSSAGDLQVFKQIECSYLVATDGAGSAVRRMMGVGMKGEVEMQRLISVHFLSEELGKFLLSSQPGMLYFVFNTRAIAVIVAHNLQVGEFIAQIPYYPPQQAAKNFTTEVCKKIIGNLAGNPRLKMEIKTVKDWVMDAQVADSFICGHDRVILAGDAAHCFPPAGGFGMNTGIQDAHNLAWKLATVLKGCASSGLLHTYEAERMPIARANTALSVANFKAAMSIPVALGLNPSTAKLVQQVIQGAASWLPDRLQGTILDAAFAVGRLQVSPAVLSESNPFGSSRIARVNQILQDGHSLQLQFPAEDLGFRYQSGALLSEIEVESTNGVGRISGFVPSVKSGARLPHCLLSTLEHGNQAFDQVPFSTLDLINSDRLGFLLIVGPRRSGCDWGDAAILAARMCGIHLNVAVLWPRGAAKLLWQQHNLVALTEQESYTVFEWGHRNRDSVIQVEEFMTPWWGQRGLNTSGAILVRPDDHVAWVTTKEADMTSPGQLLKIIKAILRQEMP